MIERGNRARFLFEPPAVLFGQPLHRDDAIEPRVARFPHFPHATRAEEGQDFVGTEPGACSQGHGVGVKPSQPWIRLEIGLLS